MQSVTGQLVTPRFAEQGSVAKWSRSWLTASVAAVSAACAVPPAESEEAAVGEMRGLVVIERSATADDPNAESASAFAGFVNIPSSVSPDRAMKLLGLAGGFPETGLCTGDGSQDARMPLHPIGQVEFVEAGTVTVEVKDEQTELAPRAFPAVTELISGLVYSTRTRAPNPLPADSLYSVRISGSPQLEQLLLTGDAPRVLAGVTINGVALEATSTVPTRAPVSVSWTPGQTGDVVVVGISTSDAEMLVQCGFADEAGGGTVTAPTEGAGRLVLHRIRAHAFSEAAVPPGVSYSELRFDFALAKSVSFVRN